jgi:DNA invertase Pin-like site-specific DNA recombinase
MELPHRKPPTNLRYSSPQRSSRVEIGRAVQADSPICSRYFGQSVHRDRVRVGLANSHTEIPLRIRAVIPTETLVGWFTDAGISGTKPRDKRPGYDRLCCGIARREFDQVSAWSVDRLGRSLQELVGFLGELHAKGVDLYLHQQGIDTATPAGKAMFQMLGVFAEFERAMIVERVRAGLARARSQGKRLGRRPVSTDLVERIREHLATGAGILKTAKALGVGTGTVHRVKREMAATAS